MILTQIINLFFLTWIPFLELRYTIPLGISNINITLPFGYVLQGYGMHFFPVFIITVLSNILLGIILYLFLNRIIYFCRKIKIIDTLYKKQLEKTQKKIHKYVEKYGILGLALFIAIPLPGSGVYSGCLGAYALGINFKDYVKAEILGVILAGVAVTLLTLTTTWLI